MALRFPDQPTASAEDINRNVANLVPQLDRSKRILKDQSIGTASTPIAHGLSGPPSFFTVTPHSSAYCWRAGDSDGVRIYVAASTACVADIEVLV